MRTRGEEAKKSTNFADIISESSLRDQSDQNRRNDPLQRSRLPDRATNQLTAAAVALVLPWMMSGAPLLPGALGPLASRCDHRFSCAALRRLASRSLSCVVRLASGGAGVGGGDGIGPTHMSPTAEALISITFHFPGFFKFSHCLSHFT